MKKLLFLLAIPVCFLAVLSFNQINTKSSGIQPSFNIKDWQIDDATAAKMMEHARHSGNDQSSIVNYNDAVRNEIMKAYPGGTGVWVNARYKDDDDEARYCKNWGIPNDANGGHGAKGRVKNYKTKIFVVTVTPLNAPDPSYYFDIAQICPPPDNCINNQ